MRPLLGGHARGDRRLLPRARPALARGRSQRGRALRARADPPRRARASCAASIRRPRRTCCAPPRSCAPRPRCSTRSSTSRSPVARGSRSSGCAALPPALARLVVIRLAEDAAGAPGPRRSAARLDELLALGRGGGSAALDLGGGVRAIVEYGVLRFARRGRRRRRAGAGRAAAARARSRSAPGGCAARSSRARRGRARARRGAAARRRARRRAARRAAR